jgi:hypothetical protein
MQGVTVNAVEFLAMPIDKIGWVDRFFLVVAPDAEYRLRVLRRISLTLLSTAFFSLISHSFGV